MIVRGCCFERSMLRFSLGVGGMGQGESLHSGWILVDWNAFGWVVNRTLSNSLVHLPFFRQVAELHPICRPCRQFL